MLATYHHSSIPFILSIIWYILSHMLSVAHATTGAFISKKIAPLYISLPLALASHYLEDAIPHWDVGQGLTKGHTSKKQAFWRELLVDFPLSIILVYFLFQAGHPFELRIWLGWFVGLLPDFIEFPKNFLTWQPWPIRQLNDFHGRFHHSTPRIFYGLVPQIALLVLFYFFR